MEWNFLISPNWLKAIFSQILFAWLLHFTSTSGQQVTTIPNGRLLSVYLIFCKCKTSPRHSVSSARFICCMKIYMFELFTTPQRTDLQRRKKSKSKKKYLPALNMKIPHSHQQHSISYLPSNIELLVNNFLLDNHCKHHLSGSKW